MKKFLLPFFLLILYSQSGCKKEEMVFPPEVKEASHLTGSSFNAQWCYSIGAHSFLLYVSEHEDFKSHLNGYDGMKVENTSYKVEGLKEYTTYYYRLKAVGKDMVSEYSKVVKVEIKASDDLYKPELYEAEELTYNGFKLSWDMVVGAEAYYLDIATDDGFTQYIENYQARKVNTVYEVIDGMDDDTKYFCRVRASKGHDYSEYSNTVCVTTPLKSCRVTKLIRSDYGNTNNNTEVDQELKMLYDEFNNPVSVCLKNSQFGGVYQQTYNYLYSYDEQKRLFSLLIKSYKRKFRLAYDEQGRVIKMIGSNSDDDLTNSIYYLEHIFTYSADGRQFTETVQGRDGSLFLHYKREYTLDGWGNITQIVVSNYENNEWSHQKSIYLTYDDKKVPKDYHLLINRQLVTTYEKTVPEAEIPFWYQQVCNVLTYKEELADGEYSEAKFNYTYNEYGYPIGRHGSVFFTYKDYGQDSDPDSFHNPDCSLSYYYTDCESSDFSNEWKLASK